MPQIPSLFNLIAQYPVGTPESVATLVGGTVKTKYFDPTATTYKNTCAIRVSRALNYAGDPIPSAGAGLSNPYMKDRKIRTDMGSDKKWYIYSVYDIRAYLSGRYGQPRRFPGTATQSALASVTGILAFAFYHVDIWDGSFCAGHEGGFGNAEVAKENIWLWPAK